MDSSKEQFATNVIAIVIVIVMEFACNPSNFACSLVKYKMYSQHQRLSLFSVSSELEMCVLLVILQHKDTLDFKAKVARCSHTYLL